MSFDPTPIPELNTVLEALVTGLQDALNRDDLLGVYLEGSFAMGDWDADSDVDFIAVHRGEMSPARLAALQELHGRIYDMPTPWAQHLEGSYFTLEALQNFNPAEKLPYLDNTARSLVFSTHSNTLVVRWVLHNHGLALDGPPPAGLVPPVSSEALCAEVRQVMRTWGDEIQSNHYSIANCWAQPFAVLSYCRMLHTLATGAVHSKPAGARWALQNLDPHWAALVEDACAARPDPSFKVRQPASMEAVARTLEFIRYARNRAAA